MHRGCGRAKWIISTSPHRAGSDTHPRALEKTSQPNIVLKFFRCCSPPSSGVRILVRYAGHHCSRWSAIWLSRVDALLSWQDGVRKFIEDNIQLLLSLALDHWFATMNISYTGKEQVTADEVLIAYRDRIRDELRVGALSHLACAWPSAVQWSPARRRASVDR